MNAKMGRRGFIALGATLVLGGVVAGTALAQQTPAAPWAGPMGPGGGMAGPMYQTIAAALGISSDELFSAMRSGKTIAQIAQERGVDLETVIDAAEKSHDTALDAQVQAGRLTREQADWMDAHMEANIRAMFAGQIGPGMMGPGFGPGAGPGGAGTGPGFGPGMMPGMGPGRHGPGMMPGFGPWRQGQ